MDIKTLLLKSLSLKTPIEGSQRIYCGRSCFLINYTINGKFLNVKTIKTKRKHKTWVQYIKHYKKALRIYGSKEINTLTCNSNLSFVANPQLDKETLTEDSNKHTKEVQTDAVLKNSLTAQDCFTQTLDVQKLAKEVQTETLKTSPKLKNILKLGSTTKTTKPVQQSQSVSLATTAQQTIASVRFSRNLNLRDSSLFRLKTTSKSCQTSSNTESKAIQCKRSTQEKASNTDIYTRDSFAQVENDLFTENTSLSEELRKRFPLPAEEFGVFIYMLNEIGETVINQNHMLKSNTEMMKQIIQISLLQSAKRMNNSSCRSISVQTDLLVIIERKNNFSQTDPECTKPRKLLIFKGRNSQHKKMEKF